MPSPAPYGADHRRRRAQSIEDAYNTPCPRCGELMLRGQRLDFGHTEDLAFNRDSQADRFEHADKADCPEGGNRSAGGKLGRRIQDLRPSRKW